MCRSKCPTYARRPRAIPAGSLKCTRHRSSSTRCNARPGLLPYVKERIDAHRDRAEQYLVTGSQNLLLAERVSESLAGRRRYCGCCPSRAVSRRGAGRRSFRGGTIPIANRPSHLPTARCGRVLSGAPKRPGAPPPGYSTSILSMRTRVWSCRWPVRRREFLRRRSLPTLSLGPCST